MPTVETISTPSAIPTENLVIPTFTPTALPENISDNLLVIYGISDSHWKNSLWIWKQNKAQLLYQGKTLSNPLISDDGEWIVLQHRDITLDENPPTDEIWLMRTDGSDLQILLGSDELNALSDENEILLINQIDWLPNQNKLLFTTDENVEGPPGSWPRFDLYLLDLEGQVTKLADIGNGGEFTVSPNGQYVIVASTTRIGVVDLETGEQLTLLNFDHLWIGCECYFIPDIFWNKESDFILTSIPPQKLHYPEQYAGSPAQVWKLFADGQVELITEFQPLERYSSGIRVSPNTQYFFYIGESCVDGAGMLYIYTLEYEEARPHSCIWEGFPIWMPDSQHFIYKLGELWKFSYTDDTTINDSIIFLNKLSENNKAVFVLNWIDDKYFLIRLVEERTCTLNIATLEGMVTEIVRFPLNEFSQCPLSQIDFIYLE